VLHAILAWAFNADDTDCCIALTQSLNKLRTHSVAVYPQTTLMQSRPNTRAHRTRCAAALHSCACHSRNEFVNTTTGNASPHVVAFGLAMCLHEFRLKLRWKMPKSSGHILNDQLSTPRECSETCIGIRRA